MKRIFELICVMNFVTFLFSASTIFAREETPSQIVLVAPWEIQERFEEMQSNVCAELGTILSLPWEEQTLENTMIPWREICGQVCDNVRKLITMGKADFTMQQGISESIEEFQLFMVKIIQDVALKTPEVPGLSEALMIIWLENALTIDADATTFSTKDSSFEGEAADERAFNMTLVQSILRKVASKNIRPSSLEMSRKLPCYRLLVNKDGGRSIALIRDDDAKAGGKVQGTIDVKWGGKDKTEVVAGVKVEGHDGKGNYIEADFSRNNKGEGNLKLTGGHEEKEDKKKAEQ